MTMRRWLLVAVGVALALVVVAGRLLIDARSALHAGQISEGRGDRLEAVRHYQDAARLYLPASPYVRDALDRLEALATAAAQAGDGLSVRAALEAADPTDRILVFGSFFTVGGVLESGLPRMTARHVG